MKAEDAQILRRLPLFDALSDAGLGLLLKDALLQRYPSGTILFNQGDTADFLHVVVEGCIELLGGGPGGSQTVVEILEPVETFILAAALTGEPYLMSAKVHRPSRILMVQARALRQAIAADPQLALALLGSLARQFRMMVRQVKNLKLRSATQRLGCFILKLAESEPGLSVALPYDKRVIASRLGMTPECLSRAFAQLRRHGLAAERNRVVIADADALRQFCQPDSLIDDVEASLSIAAEN